MLVYVVRHGIAHDRADPACPPDPERALTLEGRRRTHEVARGLLALKPRVDRLYTSPWLRAVQTLEVVREELALDEAPVTETEALLPDADPGEIAALLRRDRPRGALLTGHAPHVEVLVTWLLGGGDEPRVAMKKAAVALLDVPPTVEPGSAELQWLLPPRALRALAR